MSPESSIPKIDAILFQVVRSSAVIWIILLSIWALNVLRTDCNPFILLISRVSSNARAFRPRDLEITSDGTFKIPSIGVIGSLSPILIPITVPPPEPEVLLNPPAEIPP